MSTEIVMNEFSTLIDNEKEYSLAEFKKIFADVYKNAYKKEKKTKAKKSDDEENPKEKKPPTAYNIFVKEQRVIIKEQGLYPDLNSREIMSKIGELWTRKKEEAKSDEENNSDNGAEEIKVIVAVTTDDEVQPEEKPAKKKASKKAKKAEEEEIKEE